MSRSAEPVSAGKRPDAQAVTVAAAPEATTLAWGAPISPRARIEQLQRLVGNAATARLLMRMNDGSKAGADALMSWGDRWGGDPADDSESDEEAPTTFSLILKPEDGYTFTLKCGPGTTVADLKDFVASETLAVETTIVVSTHKQLDDKEHLVSQVYTVVYEKRDESEQAARSDRQQEATSFDLSPAVEDVLAKARYVNQDNPEMAELVGQKDSLLYYIGNQLAYTYNLITCSAITIYCNKTKLAFLDHIDVGAKPQKIGEQITKYLESVQLERGGDSVEQFIGDLEVLIYHARGQQGEQDGSLARARESLAAAGVTGKIAKIKEKEVVGTDLVVVGGETSARIVEQEDHPRSTLTDVRYAMRAYVRGEGSMPLLTGTVRDYILTAEWSRLGSSREELNEMIRATRDAAVDREDWVVAQALAVAIPARVWRAAGNGNDGESDGEEDVDEEQPTTTDDDDDV